MPLEGSAPGAAGEELSFEHRRDERPDREGVPRRDKVHRRAHEHEAHGPSSQEQLGELVGREALQARPEPVVGRVRHLGLQSDEMLDGCRQLQRQAGEEPLSREQRPVQRTRAQHVGHATSIRPDGAQPRRTGGR